MSKISDLFEQSIADAKALKEAARSSVEKALLKEHEDKIERAIEKLILSEQEEPSLFDLGGESPSVDDEISDEFASDEEVPDDGLNIPSAHADDKKKKLGMDTFFEFDIDEILKENVELVFTAPEEVVLSAIFESAGVTMDEKCDKKGSRKRDDDEGKEPLEEQSDEEDDLESDGTNVHIDYETKPTGEFINSKDLKDHEKITDIKNKFEELRTESIAIAEIAKSSLEKYTYISDKNNKLTRLLEKSLKTVKLLNRESKELRGKNERLANLVRESKKHQEKLTLEHKKAFYVIKALTDDSLNERQKKVLENAVMEAKSEEQVEVIFEAASSQFVSDRMHTTEQTLGELSQKLALGNERTISESSNRRRRGTTSNPLIERLQRNAGLNK